MTVLHEWVIEPATLLPKATSLMAYYRDHIAVHPVTGQRLAEPLYHAFNRAQTYLAIMQDQGALLVATDYEGWLPSQRDTSITHTVSSTSCTCEGFAFNKFCVHMAVFDVIQAVMGGQEVRRV